mgnify:FL=1
METYSQTKFLSERAPKQAAEIFNLERTDSLKTADAPAQDSSQIHLNTSSAVATSNTGAKDPSLQDSQNSGASPDELDVKIPDLSLPPSYNTFQNDVAQAPKNFRANKKLKRICCCTAVILVVLACVIGTSMIAYVERTMPVKGKDVSRSAYQGSNDTQKIGQGKKTVVIQGIPKDDNVAKSSNTSPTGNDSKNASFSQIVNNETSNSSASKPEAMITADKNSTTNPEENKRNITDDNSSVPFDLRTYHQIPPVTNNTSSLSAPGMHSEEKPKPQKEWWFKKLQRGFFH